MMRVFPGSVPDDWVRSLVDGCVTGKTLEKVGEGCVARKEHYSISNVPGGSEYKAMSDFQIVTVDGKVQSQTITSCCRIYNNSREAMEFSERMVFPVREKLWEYANHLISKQSSLDKNKIFVHEGVNNTPTGTILVLLEDRFFFVMCGVTVEESKNPAQVYAAAWIESWNYERSDGKIKLALGLLDQNLSESGKMALQKFKIGERDGTSAEKLRTGASVLTGAPLPRICARCNKPCLFSKE